MNRTQKPSCLVLIFSCLFVSTLFVNSNLFGQLLPEQVAVIAASGNGESEELAKYYMEKRGVPADNLLLVKVTDENKIPRAEWKDSISVEIEKWLAENNRATKIKCLVTVRGIPLTIDAESLDAPNAFRSFLENERRIRVEKTRTGMDAVKKIGVSGEIPAADPSVDALKTRPEWAIEFENVVTDAQKRIQEMNSVDKVQGSSELENRVTVLAGSNLIFTTLDKQTNHGTSNDRASNNYHFLRGRIATLQEAIGLAGQLPPQNDVDTLMLALVERASGLVGTIEWIDTNLESIKEGKTEAAFDSELSLILWRDRNYRLDRWQPNFLRTSLKELSIGIDYPTIMVARVDAPKWETCRKMIDTAIEVEKAGGLQGTVYFDARGISPQDPPSLEKQIEMDLADAAREISLSSTLKLKANNEPALFAEGECPDAVLYCGGYSLAKYVDAFDWKPGAIGYHLSTVEAMGMHENGATTWCPSLLEDGVVATIGAVEECGLGALPRPAGFFKALVDGQTVAEAFWQSNPYSSWNVILFGDPLYRPFPKNNRDIYLPTLSGTATMFAIFQCDKFANS